MGCFIMPKRIPSKRYTLEFKKLIIETMQKEKMSYRETARRFKISNHKRVAAWARIYPEEGPEGFGVERRDRGSKDRPPKQLPREIEEDLLAEVQQLRAENDHLKSLQALVLEKPALNILLSIAQLPRATFYYHLKQMRKEDKYASAKEEITAFYHENKGRYGYRRITAELRKRKFSLNHKTVQRLMKDLGLICRVRMKKYRSYKGEVSKAASNLLN